MGILFLKRENVLPLRPENVLPLRPENVLPLRPENVLPLGPENYLLLEVMQRSLTMVYRSVGHSQVISAERNRPRVIQS